jgi:gamma-glutamylcyclotransferase (GGCT)/AIG2-like uncharacterized protein YtfP
VYEQSHLQPLISAEADQQVQLPLFVYGTLRRGQENYTLLRGHTLSELPATIEGMALYSLHAYPMILEADVAGALVHGDLLTLHPRLYVSLLEDLDQLEGFRPDAVEQSRFRRVERCVKTGSGHEVMAWIYVGNPAILTSEAHVQIPHGDWLRYRHDLIRGTRFGRFELSAKDEGERP